jgi:chemotaxis-related protein WspD
MSEPHQPDSPAAAPVLDDCWNRIGVRGDRSCAALAEHAHCWNCPVHAAAALRLLDRPIADSARQEWAERIAAPRIEVEAGTCSALVFRLGSEWLALPTSSCCEVAERGPFHSVPYRQTALAIGLVNIRGELLVLADLARHLGAASAVPTAETAARLLVLSHPTGRIAVQVDEIGGVHRYHPRELREAPATVTRSERSFVNGILDWREQSVGCLNATGLLDTLTRSLG